MKKLRLNVASSLPVGEMPKYQRRDVIYFVFPPLVYSIFDAPLVENAMTVCITIVIAAFTDRVRRSFSTDVVVKIIKWTVARLK